MNVALIGCGTIGGVHAASMTGAGLKLAVCADTSRKAASAMAKQYGAKTATPEAAIKNPDVDIVAVCVPTPSHGDYVKAAAKAGKAVFCEKPFCRTAAQCRQAMKAVEKGGVKLFIAHVVRYFQDFDALRAQVASGVVGTPGFAKVHRGGGFPTGSKHWYRDYDQSGGVAFDCLIHDLDWLRFTFGEPERIFGQTLMRSKPQYLDYAQVTMKMKSGLIASATGTWAHPGGFRVKAEVCGDNGMVQFDSAEASLVGQPRNADGGGGTVIPGSPVLKSPYQLEWEDFRAWLETDRTPRVTPEDGLRAVEMAAAVLKSSKTGRAVAL